MPPQSVEILETIAALKRTLRRNSRTASSEQISQASNRGNKLKRGAQFVHQGSLAYIKGPEVYKEKIDHAGYSRYILQHNPPRFNEFGDEIEDDEEEEESDSWATEEYAYGGLKLEDLLCPLKHPSELPIHPTLSQPYTSTAIPDMIHATNKQLQKEKANLWRAKDLHRQLIGDEPWVPLELVESPADWDLFEPRRSDVGNDHDSGQGKKRKRDEDAQEGAPSINSALDNSTANAQDGNDAPTEQQDSKETDMDGAEASRDLATTEGATESNGDEPAVTTGSKTSRKDDTTIGAKDTHSSQEAIQSSSRAGKGEVETKISAAAGDTAMEDQPIADDQQAAEDEAGSIPSRSASASPAQPTRRITRALAQTNHNDDANDSNAPTPPLSPTTSDSSFNIHPLFLTRSLRSQLRQSTYNLPPAEHSDTLSLLTSYIQKQSAFINTLESVFTRLLQADRLRKTVFHWCKAEGHVGELSDGEDWIDEEAWGLERGELKKGKGDEEELEPVDGYLGRGKGKRRRGAG